MTNELSKMCSTLLKGLSPRARQVIARRFGLRGSKPETLESIGRDFGVTRERVRQIESDALKKLQREVRGDGMSYIHKYLKAWLEHLRMYGGIRREDKFLSEVGGKCQGYVNLLLALSDKLEYMPETGDLHSAWACDKAAILRAQEFLAGLTRSLSNLGRTVEEKELMTLSKSLGQAQDMSSGVILSYLELSKRIGKGPHGMWGLREWAEINPRGLRDRAYLVYKKEGRPLHFREVARLIEEYDFGRPGRRVLAQSVHNDLIRDSRFVLVGRGTYALQEWGYTPGTVREVILSAMKEAGHPLTKDEIVELVFAKRQVKPSTIFLNLQNKKYFTKTEDGKFTLVHEA